MRALEKRTVFMSDKYHAKKNLQVHRDRIKATRKCVDTSEPQGWQKARNESPGKQAAQRKVLKDHINKENFLLARRIFDIMEGPSALSKQIEDSKHLENHPGTMNFKQRLFEAQRIHQTNMILASRLDNIQPYYKLPNPTRPTSTRAKSPPKKPKTKFLRELEQSLRMAQGLPLFEQMQGEGAGGGAGMGGMGYYSDFKFLDFYKGKLDPRLLAQHAVPRPRNLILECTKEQGGRRLDVAVIKEPFQDKYFIFGMDIETAQRYELYLTSEEVSTILDGDVLVTTVEREEVWQALLNKVELKEVQAFSIGGLMEEEEPGEKGEKEPHTPFAPPQRPPGSSRGGRGSRHLLSREGAGAGGEGAERETVFAQREALAVFAPPPEDGGRKVRVVVDEVLEREGKSNWQPPHLTPRATKKSPRKGEPSAPAQPRPPGGERPAPSQRGKAPARPISHPQPPTGGPTRPTPLSRRSFQPPRGSFGLKGAYGQQLKAAQGHGKGKEGNMERVRREVVEKMAGQLVGGLVGGAIDRAVGVVGSIVKVRWGIRKAEVRESKDEDGGYEDDHEADTEAGVDLERDGEEEGKGEEEREDTYPDTFEEASLRLPTLTDSQLEVEDVASLSFSLRTHNNNNNIAEEIEGEEVTEEGEKETEEYEGDYEGASILEED